MTDQVAVWLVQRLKVAGAERAMLQLLMLVPPAEEVGHPDPPHDPIVPRHLRHLGLACTIAWKLKLDHVESTA